jgi:death on curing protein
MPGIFIYMSNSGDNFGSGQQSGEEIFFLTFEQVEAIHRDQLDRFGGQDGYRNRHLIESAVDAPRQTMFGNRLYEDIAAMASVYLFQIGESQGFTDGNKRTGVAACVTFLTMNGYELDCEDLELYDLAIATATGKAIREDVADWLRDHATRVP